LELRALLRLRFARHAVTRSATELRLFDMSKCAVQRRVAGRRTQETRPQLFEGAHALLAEFRSQLRLPDCTRSNLESEPSEIFDGATASGEAIWRDIIMKRYSNVK
jgi:hypothetical protein